VEALLIALQVLSRDLDRLSQSQLKRPDGERPEQPATVASGQCGIPTDANPLAVLVDVAGHRCALEQVSSAASGRGWLHPCAGTRLETLALLHREVLT
jgi:hypothetical protein